MKAKKLHDLWHGVEIGRGKDGFPQAETWRLFEIIKGDLPILIHDTRDNTFEAINDEDDLEEWIGDIFHHPYHDMYLYQIGDTEKVRESV